MVVLSVLINLITSERLFRTEGIGMGKQKLLWLLGAVVALFLVIDLIAGLVASDQWAVGAALAACRERGWQDGDLVLSRSELSTRLLGKTATIDFKENKGRPPKTVRVTLRKPINLLAWRVVDFQQQP